MVSSESRIDRRDLLRSALAAASLSVLWGCGPTTGSPVTTSTTTTDAPRGPRGTLTWAGIQVPAALDPHNALPPVGDIAARLAFDSLVSLNERGEVIPQLAERWRLVDPLTWEFTLRPRVRFASGAAVTAEVIKWNFERVSDLSNRLQVSARVPTFDRADVVDSQTIRLRTKAPDPLWVRRTISVLIVDPAEAAQPDFSFNPGPKAGTGMFRIVEFDPGQRVALEATESWRGVPRLERVILRAVPDPAAVAAGLRTGDIDLALVSAERASELERAGLKRATVPQSNIYMIWLKTNAGGPLADRRVRLALNLAIDRDAIVRGIYQGAGSVANQNVGPEAFGYNPELRPYPFDVMRARSLLAEAGYANGFETALDVIQGSAATTPGFVAAAGYLNEVGVRVTIVPHETNVFVQKTFSGDRNPLFGRGGQYGPALDADFNLSWFSNKQTNPNAVFYNNPEFQQLYDASIVEMDIDKRRQLLQRASQVLYDDAAFIPVLQPVDNWVMNSRVTGFVPHPVGLGSVNWQNLAVSS
jgi:peptide/nickel transport system substrate-binding protein